MSKVISIFLGVAACLSYSDRALEQARYGPALGGVLCAAVIFYCIWFRLEEVD